MRSIKKIISKGDVDRTTETTYKGEDNVNKDNNKLNKHGDKDILCKIRLLDDTQPPLELMISKNDHGRRVFTFVCGSVGDLAEPDYFGLRFTDRHGQRQWLDLDRTVFKQMKGCKSFNLSFRLKHYPADPMKDVKQDFTRYLIYLQIRRDLAQGRLLCPSDLMSQIGALIVQAELGDYPSEEETTSSPDSSSLLRSKSDEKETGESESPVNVQTSQPSIDYLKGFKIFNAQTPKTLIEIAKEHEKLRGLTPQEAESEILSRTCVLPTYGIDPFLVTPLHKIIIPKSGSPKINGSGDQINSTVATNTANSTPSIPTRLPPGIAFYLGITSAGLVTFVGLQRSQEYNWDRIQRLACDGRNFVVLVKRDELSAKKRFLRSKTQQLTFECESKYAALAIWHWTMDRKFFFTLKDMDEAKRVRPTSSIFRRSHTYRFSGRSQQQLKSIPIKNPSSEFIRISSLRHDGNLGSVSMKHATLPSRMRPPLDLREDKSNELFEVASDSTPTSETLKPVVIPDTVVEHPAEEDSPTLMEINKENVKPVADVPSSGNPVEEPMVEVKVVPEQLNAPTLPNGKHSLQQNSSDLRNRVDSKLIHSVVYQQVVSEFDNTIDTHMSRFTNGAESNTGLSVNGVSHKNGTASFIRNGPISSKAAKIVTETCEEEDTGKGYDCSGIAKTTTATVVTVMVIVGLIVLMETSPSTDSTVLYTMRNNVFVSNIDNYIYTPLRNAISAGLALLWS